MKIAINCAFFQPRGGGIAEYIRNLVSNVEKIDTEDEYILYVLEDIEQYARDNMPSRFRIKTIPYTVSYRDKIKRSLFEQRFWSNEEETERFDIYHSPFFHSPHFKKAKVIITVHDLRFYRFPRTYTFPRYVFLKYKVRKSVKAADHIITISAFTKSELMDAYKLPSEKITVIHEAINRERFSRETPESAIHFDNVNLTGADYVLSVGHIEPRKNYERLMVAFEKMKETNAFPNLKLVIVGKKDNHCKRVLKMVNELPDVVYLNFVSHDQLLWLYRHAKLFVFPSFYEGFGFPPLEAGCLGAISAVSNVSSMPEVCGDAVAYFNPYDVDEMASVMARCLSDEKYRLELRERMNQQLDIFSWRDNAVETVAIYKKVVTC